MSDHWKQFDLQGEGLQSANLKLLRLMKRRRTAYVLWLLGSPFGMHRAYLDDVRGTWAYRLISVAAIASLVANWREFSLAIFATIAILAIYDLVWIDRRVTERNKKLRMRIYLRHGSDGAPTDFQGRLADDAEADFEEYLLAKEAERPERGAAIVNRAPSLAQQEAMLRELARNKQQPPKV